MAKKENMATGKELNEIELERAFYLINSDELILETLGATIEDQLEMPPTSTIQYKCPTCKNAISIKSADFINGFAVTSCGDCGRNAFAIEDFLLN